MEFPQNADNVKSEISAVSARQPTGSFQCKLIIDSRQIFQQLNITNSSDLITYNDSILLNEDKINVLTTITKKFTRYYAIAVRFKISLKFNIGLFGKCLP